VKGWWLLVTVGRSPGKDKREQPSGLRFDRSFGQQERTVTGLSREGLGDGRHHKCPSSERREDSSTPEREIL